MAECRTSCRTGQPLRQTLAALAAGLLLAGALAGTALAEETTDADAADRTAQTDVSAYEGKRAGVVTGRSTSNTRKTRSTRRS